MDKVLKKEDCDIYYVAVCDCSYQPVQKASITGTCSFAVLLFVFSKNVHVFRAPVTCNREWNWPRLPTYYRHSDSRVNMTPLPH